MVSSLDAPKQHEACRRRDDGQSHASESSQRAERDLASSEMLHDNRNSTLRGPHHSQPVAIAHVSSMTLFVIGLGLCDEKDITLRALEAVKSSTRVYLEAYTSILMVE